MNRTNLDTAGIVAAVGMADALLEQFGEVLRRLDRVAAARKMDALALRDLAVEANQVYQGMWQQLDTARELAAGGGFPVGDFDAIRGRQTSISEGVTIPDLMVDSPVRAVRAVMGNVVASDGITAMYEKNVRGMVDARHASAALKRAVPDAPWNIAAPSTEVPDLQSGAQTIRIVYAIVMIGLVALMLYLFSKAS